MQGKKKARKTTTAGGSGVDLAKIAAEQSQKIQAERAEIVEKVKQAQAEKEAAKPKVEPEPKQKPTPAPVQKPTPAPAQKTTPAPTVEQPAAEPLPPPEEPMAEPVAEPVKETEPKPAEAPAKAPAKTKTTKKIVKKKIVKPKPPVSVEGDVVAETPEVIPVAEGELVEEEIEVVEEIEIIEEEETPTEDEGEKKKRVRTGPLVPDTVIGKLGKCQSQFVTKLCIIFIFWRIQAHHLAVVIESLMISFRNHHKPKIIFQIQVSTSPLDSQMSVLLWGSQLSWSAS